jgi:enoyl-CoA hydratase/carnithine racemase
MQRSRVINQVIATSQELQRRARVQTARFGQRRAAPVVHAANDEPTAVVSSQPAPGVLEIRLTGGTRRNVLGRLTLERIESLVEFAPAETRVILLSADGPDFCAGYDLFEAARDGAESLLAHESNLAPLRRSSCPIIAALHGNVIGGGLELALAADVRLASRDVRLAIPASALGLVYSEAGTRLLVDELGESTTRAMLLGGKSLDANEALASGLVTDLVALEDLDARALELATRIASWSPVATAGNRRVLDVVAGRVTDDTAALRLASFAPHSALASSIERFVNRRAAAPPPVPTYRRIAHDSWQLATARANHLLSRRAARLNPTR